MVKYYETIRTSLMNRMNTEPRQLVSEMRKASLDFSSEHFKIMVLLIVLLLATFWHRNAQAQTGCSTAFSPFGCVAPPVVASSNCNSAIVNSSWTAWPGNANVVVGYVWATSASPTLASLGTNSSGSVANPGSGVFPASVTNISGLTAGATYYIRSYITTPQGTNYSDVPGVTFNTPLGATVSTLAISNITSSTAGSGGQSIICVGSSVTQKGIVWSTSPNPTTANSLTNDGTGTANYGSSLTGLSMGITYYVRAYIIDGGTTYYGQQVSFKTKFTGVSPYSLTPQWYFGNRGGLSFPSNNYPSSSAPTPVLRVGNVIDNEASTSISYRSGAVALYSNALLAYNEADVAIRDFQPAADNTCGGSATGGAIAFPNPKNPNNEFYMVIANDLTAGPCAGAGQNGYKFAKSGANQAYSAGPSIATRSNATASEAIAISTDGAGSYWLAGHDKNGSNFHLWKFDTTGAITAQSDQSRGASIGVTNSQATIKFSPCQDKIAVSGGGLIQVFPFNRITGTVSTTSLFSGSGYDTRGGLEFSEDGSKIYFSGSGLSDIYQIDLNTGTYYSVGIGHGFNSWSMQLGLDGEIYTSPQTGGSTYIKKISNNNSTSPTLTTITLAGSGKTFRGLSNLAWLSPNNPVVAATTVGASCNIKSFSYSFNNYFNTTINILPGSEVWNFGDGSGDLTSLGATPTHTYSTTSAPTWYNVKVTFKDLYCNHTWSDTINVKVDCPIPTPVEFVKVAANKYDNDKVKIVWITAQEKSNDRFDVQRSIDGKQFKTIGTVKGQGTSTNTQTYSYIDDSPSIGASYYRIVQVDLDNSIKSSNIVAVSLNKTSVLFAPNPFQEDIMVNVEGVEGKATINVYDATGRLVLQTFIEPDITSTRFGSNLGKGSYIVEVIGSDINIHQKIIKD